MGRRWTEDEDDLVRHLYPTMGEDVCVPGRNNRVTLARAKKLGLIKPMERWEIKPSDRQLAFNRMSPDEAAKKSGRSKRRSKKLRSRNIEDFSDYCAEHYD